MERTVSAVEAKRARTVKQFCADYGVGKTMTYAEIKAGHLRAVKVGDRALILHEDSEASMGRLVAGGDAVTLIEIYSNPMRPQNARDDTPGQPTSPLALPFEAEQTPAHSGGDAPRQTISNPVAPSETEPTLSAALATPSPAELQMEVA